MGARGQNGAVRRWDALWLLGLCVLVASAAGCGTPEAQLRSVVLVVVDTLRADHMSVYGYERPTTPEIESWAKRGALFERAWSSSPWTLPAFGTLYTGHLPSGHGAGKLPERTRSEIRETGRTRPDLEFASLSRSQRTLAELLSEAGLATAAVVNNPFLARAFGVARGFDFYNHAVGEGSDVRRSDVVVDAALRWIGKQDGEPFFVVAHLMDPHTPYDPAPATRGRFTGSYSGPLRLPIHDVVALRSLPTPLPDADRDFIRGVYDEEVAFADIQVGRLLDRLEQSGLLGETLVVLTSDHGEEIFEHGGFEHGHQMYQELLHVPLVFWGPGIRPGRLATPVSHLDVMPTILDALSIEPPTTLPGRSLWPALTSGADIEERSIVAEATLYGPDREALVRWPWKLIRQRSATTGELFDLETDPEERRDLAATNPEQLQALLAQWDAPRKLLQQGSPMELDDRTREQLEDLGYLDPRQREDD